MELSKRLLAIANGVLEGAHVADIGTDHAYLPIYLVEKKNIKKVIAMDVNEGPLKRAKENILKYQMASKIETRQSNGLTQLKKDEVDTITISGMGGLLIKEILEAGEKLLTTINRVIIQPQSDVGKVRKCLHQLGFKIVDETFVYEDGKYYNIIIADRGKELYPPEDYFFGKCLQKKKDPVFKDYLEKEYQQKKKILATLEGHSSTQAHQRRQEIEKELLKIQEVLACL